MDFGGRNGKNQFKDKTEEGDAVTPRHGDTVTRRYLVADFGMRIADWGNQEKESTLPLISLSPYLPISLSPYLPISLCEFYDR